MKRGGGALLLAAVVVFFGATLMGFRLLTSAADVTVTAPDCESRTVKEGEPLTPNLVAVDIYNASRTAGLADRVSRQMQTRNFLPGAIGNNRTDFTTSDILVVTEDSKDPRVRLVATQFTGPVKFAKGKVQGSSGVAVLVGKNYADKELKKNAQSKIKSDRVISACIPAAPKV